MLSILPPVFIILGLLDTWISRETMMNLLGHQAGARGVVVAFLVGSVGAGPLYAAFPIVGVLLKKGCSMTNAFIFMGAWTTTKLTLLLFGATALGWRFMLIRFLLDIPAVLIIAYITTRTLKPHEQSLIYEQARAL
jgi:uncharacterized membrane protein YraQ (UPF0718 family)